MHTHQLGEDVSELVVIFSTNVWEYDVLDYLPISDPRAKAAEAAVQKR